MRIESRSVTGARIAALLILCLPWSLTEAQTLRFTKQFSILELTALRHFSVWQFGTPSPQQMKFLRCGSEILDVRDRVTALNQLTANTASHSICLGPPGLLDDELTFRRNVQRSFELAESERRPFVYMGEPTDSDPEVVALGLQGGVVTCSGVLLQKRIILTAAHCTCRPYGPPTVVYYEPVVTDGADGVPITEEPHRLEADECPTDGEKAFGKDIAILVTSSDVPSASFARLASPMEEHLASTVSIFGYGKASYADAGGARTFAAGVAIASPNCTETLPPDPAHAGNTAQSRYGCVPKKEFVAGTPWGNMPDSCAGDSGGPALIRTAEPGRDAVVMGIVSRAVRTGLCGDGGVYELVSPEVQQWICKQYSVRGCPQN